MKHIIASLIFSGLMAASCAQAVEPEIVAASADFEPLAQGRHDCITCAEKLAGHPGKLCPQSKDLWKAFVECGCQGACSAVCEANWCPTLDTQNPDPACGQCLQDTVIGCGLALEACDYDF